MKLNNSCGGSLEGCTEECPEKTCSGDDEICEEGKCVSNRVTIKTPDGADYGEKLYLYYQNSDGSWGIPPRTITGKQFM